MDIDLLCRAVTSPAELRKLPGYISRVNPKVLGLRRIIWPYRFRSDLQCALTNCRAHHKEGVIVELEDGSVSNIGHVCGGHRDKFSTKFQDEMQKLSESRLREEMMPLLLNRAELQRIQQLARTAYTQGKQWVSRMRMFARLYPDISAELTRRQRAGADMAVTEIVRRTEREIEDVIASGLFRTAEAARYKEVRKGGLKGTAVLSLTETSVEFLWRRADALLAADPQMLVGSDLHNLYAEAHNLPNAAREVLRQCEAGNEFFDSSNVALMAQLSKAQTGNASLLALTVEMLDARSVQESIQGRASTRPAKPLSKKQQDHFRRAEKRRLGR